MNRLTGYLKEAKIFYLATSSDNKPSIRPIGGKPGFDGNGFVELDGKLYFYTDNRKSMYKQMVNNPYVAMTFLVSKGFVRVYAECVFDDNMDAKKAMLSENQILTNLYNANDDYFKVYYMKDVEAYLYSVGQEPVKLN